jgi:hypothetical protein
MDAIDRYLRIVGWLLPKATRHDIIRELEEELRAQADDTAQRLGRPLDPAEQRELVRAYGHPLVLAARYRPDRYLIGPVMIFPYYRLVVAAIVGLTIAGHTIGMIILLAGAASFADLGGPVERLVSAVLSEVGWLTLLAAAADFMIRRTRVLESWSGDTPAGVGRGDVTLRRALAQVPGARRASRPVARAAQPNRRLSVPALVGGLALSGWWLLALRFPVLLFGGGAAHIAWGPAMHRLFPVLVLADSIYGGAGGRNRSSGPAMVSTCNARDMAARRSGPRLCCREFAS